MGRKHGYGAIRFESDLDAMGSRRIGVEVHGWEGNGDGLERKRWKGRRGEEEGRAQSRGRVFVWLGQMRN